MVDANDCPSARARRVNRGEMIARVDQKTRGAGIEVFGSMRLFDARRRTNQQAAALDWQRLARVRDDRIDGSTRNFYKASTAIAIPIPPPMQSDATP